MQNEMLHCNKIFTLILPFGAHRLFTAIAFGGIEPRIIAVKFLFDQNDERVGLQFKIAKPVLVNPVDPFWHYMNSAFRMRLSDYGAEGKEHTFETDQGDKVTVSCKPKA